jgi:hypothetical protein
MPVDSEHPMHPWDRRVSIIIECSACVIGRA